MNKTVDQEFGTNIMLALLLRRLAPDGRMFLPMGEVVDMAQAHTAVSWRYDKLADGWWITLTAPKAS